jgi:beta-lactamase class A
LKKKLTAIVAKYPKIQPQAFFVDLDTGAYVDLKAEVPIAAASTIKIPVLVAFLQAADAGKVHLDEMLVMTKDVKAGGSGDMQYQPLGKKYSALETATKMIAISDNTATNMLIERLGGKAALNQQFQKWGLGATAIKNPLPDLEGTNTTSPRDLAKLLEKVNQGELLSLKSRDRLLSIMEQTQTRTLLPQGLEAGAAIAHKTGDIGTVLGDAGIVDMPSGKRYIGAILAKRPYNDSAARSLIQQMSQTAYQHFKWYRPRPLLKQGE